MRQFRIYPYKMGSGSAGRLAEGLRERGIRGFKVYPDRHYAPKTQHTIINWGNSTVPQWAPHMWEGVSVLNYPHQVSVASNKLTAFQIMQDTGVSVPEFTTDPVQANAWGQEGATIVARHKLQGHSGEGVEIIQDSVFDHHIAPLYVKYIKKQEEYRIHVFRGEVIDIQQKKKRQEIPNEEVNYQIRNHQNGWVYCRDGVHPPQSVLDNAIRAVDSLYLDFGAVDVIWNNHYQQAYVLEVNTAPGLEGTTLTKYVNKFSEVL